MSPAILARHAATTIAVRQLSEVHMSEKFQIHRQLDARGLRCPLPLLRAKQALAGLAVGEVLEVLATDAGAARDIPAWCQLADQQLLQHSATPDAHGVLHFVIRRLH